MWRFTTQRPPDDWTKPDFNAANWQQGQSSFGTTGTPGAVVHTRWDTDDIWLRREITMPDKEYTGLQFIVDHDEDVEIYVNGVLAASAPGFTVNYVPMEIKPDARKLLTPGATVSLAVHCHQTTGGQNIDVGLATVSAVE